MAASQFKVSLILLAFVIFTTLFFARATSGNKTKQSSCNMAPRVYCAAIPEMNGKPGSPGIPGRDGRDGRDGAKGNQGIPGKTGPQGPPGPSGNPGDNRKDCVKGERGTQGKSGPQGSPGLKGNPGANGKVGSKGERGAQGPPGQKGERGESGLRGTPGNAGLMSLRNWKECAWKEIADDKDNGLIKECVFRKNFSDTALHVSWTGTLRVAGCTGCCKRWYFTFNGAECSAPLPIEGIVYLGTLPKSSINPHRVRNIEGHCNNIRQGKVRVGFWVGNCARASGSYDAYTGWNAVSRIFVEEVPKAQA